MNAACEVFAEKGYRNAKVVEICSRAGANVASVNYYFKNKASLYAETWRYTFLQFEDQVFSVSSEGAPMDRLRVFIQTLMQNVIKKGEEGHFIRLYLMELANPTGLVKNDWRELVNPERRKLHDVIRALIGPDADEQDVRFCELSIITQCRALLTIKRNDLEFLLCEKISPDLIRRLTDHIVRFSLAGTKAVGR